MTMTSFDLSNTTTTLLSSSSSYGALLGGIFGGLFAFLVLVGIVAALVYVYIRRQQRKQPERETAGEMATAPSNAMYDRVPEKKEAAYDAAFLNVPKGETYDNLELVKANAVEYDSGAVAVFDRQRVVSVKPIQQ